MTHTTVEEFIQALAEEIQAIKDAAKRGKGAGTVKVFNGRFLREVGGLYVYVFNLENFLAVLEDSPAEIDIHGARHQAQVLSTQGLEVEVGIERFCGQFIPEAKLQTNSWYLLELLKDKYIEYLDGRVQKDFRLSDALFSGQSISPKKPTQTEPRYSISKDVPNGAQEKAIRASFSSGLCIVWGPPGTGKTKTIAQAIETHLNAGRRVLLVSHANNAVDEALEKVAVHLKPTLLYQEGKLVRLGKPQEEHLRKLEEDCPLVLLDKIAEKLGETLSKEKHTLEKERLRLEDQISQLGRATQAVSVAKTLASEREKLFSTWKTTDEELARVTSEITLLEATNNQQKEKLVKANSASALRRFFSGLDPKKIQWEIDRASLAIDAKNRRGKELAARAEELDSELRNKRQQAAKAEDDVRELLRQLKTTEPELQKTVQELHRQQDSILSRIAEINRRLEETTAKILSEAMLVATTLTKTFVAKQFPDSPFDVLVLDEASMAPLPHVYWAAGRCRESVSIVGDFLQLPPICVAEKEAMAEKWLGRSIFDVLGINSVAQARKDPRVTMLDTQYRMHPDISAISNRLFYEGLLKDASDTSKHIPGDGIPESPLVFVETSAANPWCSQLSKGGRFNLYNALVSTTIAKKIIGETPSSRVGIITPYAAQARLINKIAKDWQLLDRVRISTVHRFQGGEEPIIIFDSCEGPGVRVAPMLDDKSGTDARFLLNVAMTRAKHKLYLVGHSEHLLRQLHRDSSLARIVRHFQENAKTIASQTMVDHYFDTDFEKWSAALLGTVAETSTRVISGELFTQKNFWAQFLQDLQTVNERLIILSPFLSIKRSGPLVEYFRAMIGKGITVRIHTRPKAQQTGEMANQSEIVIEQLRSIGAKVTERRGMHQKVALLDNRIAWEGSLNILSHRYTEEHMRRFEGESAIEEIIRNLELDDDNAVSTQTTEKCPGSKRKQNCDGYLVVRSKYGRRFFGCSTYPECDYTRPIDGVRQGATGRRQGPATASRQRGKPSSAPKPATRNRSGS